MKIKTIFLTKYLKLLIHSQNVNMIMLNTIQLKLCNNNNVL